MWISVLVACMLSVQPVCDRVQFEIACGEVLKGEQKNIGNAVFDAYLDQVDEIDESNLLRASQEATSLLENFTDSLALLDDTGSWREASSNLLNSVLLQSRQVANPWPATVWIDVHSIDVRTVSDETNNAVTSFLHKHFNKDLEERHFALAAIRSGDSELCEQLTANAMKRWMEYQKIIKPYMSNRKVQFAAYPKLNTGQRVIDVVANLTEPTSPPLQVAYEKWLKWHDVQTQATIALIRSARSTYLFDPWSPRCGMSTNRQALNLQQELLQLSATMRDKNDEAIKLLQSVAHETQ